MELPFNDGYGPDVIDDGTPRRILQIRAWGNTVATIACLGAVGIMTHNSVVVENMPIDGRVIIGICFSVASAVNAVTALRAFQGKY